MKTYRERERAELERLFASHPNVLGPAVPSLPDGEIDLNKINPMAVSHAQARALGSMLDDLLAARAKPDRRRAVPKAKPTPRRTHAHAQRTAKPPEKVAKARRKAR